MGIKSDVLNVKEVSLFQGAVLSLYLFSLCIGLIYSLEEDMREAITDLQSAVTVP